MAREYKDSGIEWIGQIPKEWKVPRLKNVAELHGRIGWNGLRSEEFEEQSYAYLVTGQDFVSSEINWNKCYQIRKERYEEDEFIQLKEGELLVTKDGTIGKVAIVSNMAKPACLNSGIFVLRQKVYSFFPKYLYWQLYSPLLKTYNDYMNLGGTTIIHLYQNVFERMPLILPSPSEQQKIADYLDKVCGEADEMIALQEKMIEELKAYKQSIITEAVTKGLNPNVPMKNSGIDWIGEIPEGWKICRIKNVAALFGRIGFRGYTSDDLNKDGDGAITLSPSNMIPMGMDFSKVTYLSWKKYEESPEIMIRNGDLLMVKTGSSYGKVSYVDNLPKEATINPQILRVVPSINHKYLGYYMQTDLFIYQVEGGVVGGTIPTISQEKINNFHVVLPPLSEQQSIVSYLDSKCSEIDSLITIKQQKITELKEYKKSVIYEYVTGKKEVV